MQGKELLLTIDQRTQVDDSYASILLREFLATTTLDPFTTAKNTYANSK